MLGKINKNGRFDLEDISLNDMISICREIAIQDKSTRSLFNKHKIKARYSKRLSELGRKALKTIGSTDSEQLEEVLKEMNKLIERYKKLRPTMDVKETVRNEKVYYEFDEASYPCNLAPYLAKLMFRVEQNERMRLREKKVQQEKEEERRKPQRMTAEEIRDRAKLEIQLRKDQAYIDNFHYEGKKEPDKPQSILWRTHGDEKHIDDDGKDDDER